MKINEKIDDLKFNVFHDNKIKESRISDYKKKWLVLVFYPADFTFVCPTELEDFADKYDEFKRQDAEVISISTDSVYVHKAWQNASEGIRKIKFPMAGDSNGKICNYFGTYIEEEGVSIRATIIIDPDGKIKYIEMHDNNVGRNVNEILRKLKALKYVREHPEEVCPARWDENMKTIKPSLDLIGKL